MSKNAVKQQINIDDAKIPQSDNIDSEPSHNDGGLVDQAIHNYLNELTENQKKLTDSHLKWRMSIGAFFIFLFFLHLILGAVLIHNLFANYEYFVYIQNSSVLTRLFLTESIVTLSIASVIIAVFVKFPDISSKIIVAIHKKNMSRENRN